MRRGSIVVAGEEKRVTEPSILRAIRALEKPIEASVMDTREVGEEGTPSVGGGGTLGPKPIPGGRGGPAGGEGRHLGNTSRLAAGTGTGRLDGEGGHPG